MRGASSPAPAAGQLLNRYLTVTENWIYRQLAQLRRFRPVVLARRRSHVDLFPLPGVHTVDQLPRLRRALDRTAEAARGYSPTLLAAARAERIQLLHAHFGPLGVSALPLVKRLGIPLITSFYGFDLGRGGERRLTRAYRRLFAEGTAFVVEGTVARARLIALGCPPDRVAVNRIGADLTAIPFAPRARAAGSPLRVLMAARFTEKKGFPYGVEALCAAARAGVDLTATIVGDAGRGAAEQRIKRRLHDIVAASGAPGRFRFTGRVSPEELRRLMYDHDVLLQPSVHAADGDCEGGLPVSLIEAAAAGMGLIASEHCDIPDLVRTDATGWLCAERDVPALARALGEAWREPELVARYGAAARARAEAEFDLGGSRLDEIYAAVLAGRPVASVTSDGAAVRA